MLTIHQEQIKNLLNIYGAYEVTKVLKEYTVAASCEYKSLGNYGAVIHSDAHALNSLCHVMAKNHPIRSKDVPQ